MESDGGVHLLATFCEDFEFRVSCDVVRLSHMDYIVSSAVGWLHLRLCTISTTLHYGRAIVTRAESSPSQERARCRRKERGGGSRCLRCMRLRIEDPETDERRGSWMSGRYGNGNTGRSHVASGTTRGGAGREGA